jgi:hypothetical protein
MTASGASEPAPRPYHETILASGAQVVRFFDRMIGFLPASRPRLTRGRPRARRSSVFMIEIKVLT